VGRALRRMQLMSSKTRSRKRRRKNNHRTAPKQTIQTIENVVFKQRVPPKQIGPVRWERFSWYIAVALAFFVLFKHDTTAWSLGLLTGLWLCLLLAAHSLEFISGGSRRRRILVGATTLVCISAGMFIFGRHVWPKGLGTLSEKERQRLVSVLKSESHPTPVHLMCPPTEEEDCAVATQFIDIFGRAGWPLTIQYVDRVTAGNPRSGVYFVLHSTADKDYSKPEYRQPNVGVWTELPSGYLTIKDAFGKLGIDTSEEVGTSFPAHTIGIYFGVGTARR
jgi:hypothetical protein